MFTTAQPNLLLVNMPWATERSPWMALGILRSLALKEGVSVRTFFANLDMAAIVGLEIAAPLSDQRPLYGVSEHYFAVDMFGAEALNSEDLLDSICRELAAEVREDWCKPFADIAFMRHLRDEVVPRFLDRAVQRVLEWSPEIIGFTATFNQVMSSLALAKRIKAVRPDIQIIAGGACFDGEMGQEYHRALPSVLDHVFVGEAEEGFIEYLRRFKAKASTRGIPGVTTWFDGSIELIPGRPLANMNESPAPDYDDFFAEAARLREETGRVFNVEYLPYESSRGCWWGQKNHCVFCGINSDLMAFRPKEAGSSGIPSFLTKTHIRQIFRKIMGISNHVTMSPRHEPSGKTR